MTSTIVKSRELEDGCRLEMADISRKLVGDRWVVTLEVRLHIPVTAGILEQAGVPAPDIETLRGVLGEAAVFTQRKEQVFVDDSDREAVFATLLRQFEEGPLAYLQNPRFPGRFLIRQYEQEKRRIR